MIIGSDYDETFSDHPELWSIANLIITGRSWEDYENFTADKVGPDIPVFMNPAQLEKNNVMEIVQHKANIINKIGISKFYEDQPDEAKMIQLLAPKCKVILVKKGYTQI